MKYFQQASVAVMAALCLILPTSCTHNDDNGTPAVTTKIQIKTSATLGNYLADNSGYSLYYFSNDYNGLSNCTGGCLNAWPIYYAGDNLAQSDLPSGLDLADFGTITTPSGARQTTYKSWPLYYYAPATGSTNTREAPSQTTGDGVGSVWYVAKPDYTVMLVNAQLVGNDGQSYKSDLTVGTGKTLYFSDAKGVTLYGFAPDSFNVNKYTKPDFSNDFVWPIYQQNKVVVPSTLDKTQFATANVFGKTQLTYKGWPLYYFVLDSMMRGKNKGVSVPTPGVWPVINKDVAPAPKP